MLSVSSTTLSISSLIINYPPQLFLIQAPKGREAAAIAVISAIPTTEVARVIALFARSLLFGACRLILYSQF